MPKKRRNAKKAAQLPWILANNPGDNNRCQCFKNRLPNKQWIAVNSFKTQSDCTGFVADCSSFFMKMPIQGMNAKMGMMMGLRARRRKLRRRRHMG